MEQILQVKKGVLQLLYDKDEKGYITISRFDIDYVLETKSTFLIKLKYRVHLRKKWYAIKHIMADECINDFHEWCKLHHIRIDKE